MSSTNARVLDEFIHASILKDHEAFLAMLTDDIEYVWNPGVRPIVGKATMAKFLRNYSASFEQLEWIVRHRVEQGDTMLCEGVEKLRVRATGQLIENPFMQAIEFRDGKISRLRDYYDASRLPAPATAGSPRAGAKVEALRRLQAAVEARDKDAFLAFFAPDVVYHYHVGSRPLVGREWVEKFIVRYWAQHSATRWEILRHAESGDCLLTEGVEEYVNADGVAVRHPYMGVIEFRGDLICGWRDYFQMRDPGATK